MCSFIFWSGFLVCCAFWIQQALAGQQDFPSLPTSKTTVGYPEEEEDYPTAGYPEEEEEYPEGTDKYNRDTFNEVVKTVLQQADTEIVPKQNLSEPLDFSISFDLLSLASFEEISGEISIVASLKLVWAAETTPTWNPNYMLGGKKSVTVSAADIWKPQLFVLNPSKKVRDLTSDLERLRIRYDGTVEWSIVTVIEAACGLDVTYFPFDAQTCSIFIAPWGYDNTELTITGTTTTTSDYLSQDHSSWGLLALEATGNNDQTTPYLNVTVQFKRRYEFFLINILLPPTLLSALNPCVFLLPAASGERMSFSITCFLAFSVFMSLLGDNMPKSSTPISHLSYFLMFMLVHSCFIALVTILSLRIYNKDGISPVPKWVQTLVKLVRFRYCRDGLWQRKTQVEMFASNENSATEPDFIDVKKHELSSTTVDGSLPNDDITWYLVGRTLDYFFFCLFLGWILFSLTTTLMALTII